jgi:hypothetical protein
VQATGSAINAVGSLGGLCVPGHYYSVPGGDHHVLMPASLK